MSTRRFALILGLFFVAAGIAGFIPFFAHPEAGTVLADNALAAGNSAHSAMPMMLGTGHDMLFGLFPVNPVHNGVHLLFGLWGLIAARGRGAALFYARFVAILYAVLALAGLLPATQTGFGLLPLYAKDVWLHGAIALAGAYFGWVTQESQPR
jgi:hypothetical protein